MLDESENPNLETPEAPPPEESGNRTFLIVAGIFAGLIFLTLVCGAGYVLWLGPRLTAQRNAAQATIEAENAQVIQQMTSTAEVALWTPTLQASPTLTATNTVAAQAATSTNTPVVAVSSPTFTSTSTTDPATLAAMQTQLAANMTATSIALGTPASTQMPATGLFDQVGLPSLIILAVALVAVIFLARRMRRAPSR